MCVHSIWLCAHIHRHAKDRGQNLSFSVTFHPTFLMGKCGYVHRPHYIVRQVLYWACPWAYQWPGKSLQEQILVCCRWIPKHKNNTQASPLHPVSTLPLLCPTWANRRLSSTVSAGNYVTLGPSTQERNSVRWTRDLGFFSFTTQFSLCPSVFGNGYSKGLSS